jgi:hypothetical protein
MTFPSITLTGSIFTFDTLEKIASFEEVKQSPADYGFSSRDELRDQILFEWGSFKDRYRNFGNKIQDLSDDKKKAFTADKLIKPLLNDLAEYDLVKNKEVEIINDREYLINHRASALDGLPVIIIGGHQSLDKKEDKMRSSSHALMQEYLNHTDHLYGIVTNGIQLRILRDSSILTKLSYLEFNLEKMVEDDLYADFALLYLLIHRSRMPQEMGAESSYIETYHLNGLESGSRIREKLSIAVEQSILRLGQDLLGDGANDELRAWIAAQGQDAGRNYYSRLLKVIYRLLFIMVIEERDLIFEEADKE